MGAPVDSCSAGTSVARGAIQGAADAFHFVAVAHNAHHVVESGDMVGSLAVDVDGLTGDQAGDFQAEMHGVRLFDELSIGDKKAPGDGGCASSGFGYSGD